MCNKTAIVFGAGGFIGNHLAARLKDEGYWVRGVDRKYPEFGISAADDFVIADLSSQQEAGKSFDRPFDEVYQLAAEMGGAGYIFVGDNDFEIMASSSLINLNIARLCNKETAGRVLFTSSACVYNEYNQSDLNNYTCEESTAYPAQPDSEYGWEKLFSERLYQTLARNAGIPTRIARLHNIFGPRGSWCCGREKAPAAVCRKVAETGDGGEISIWGDGKQVRSFLYIDECLDGIRTLMKSDCGIPINIGSDEAISIGDLVTMAIEISGKQLSVRHEPGPQGVRARCSDNELIEKELGWRPRQPLRQGMEATYAWIEQQVRLTA